MRLAPLHPDQLNDEQQALYEAINGAPRGPVHLAPDGTLMGPFNALLYNPTVGSPLLRLGATLRYEGLLPPRTREIAILIVASTYRSEYEWYQHAPEALRHGLAGNDLEAIQERRWPDLEDEADQCAVELTRHILDRTLPDDAALARAVRALGEDGVVELTTLVGYYSLLAFQMALLDVQLPPGVPASLQGSADPGG
jgi:4-carboxymuconolactone decarboxylase